MASIEKAKSIKCEHKLAIDELLKEAGDNDHHHGKHNDGQCSAVGGNLAAQQQATTKGEMRNDTLGPIKFTDEKDWSGSVLGSFPPNVDQAGSGTFSHRGTPPKDLKGSKGAVVYYGTNTQDKPPNCAWVFAWNTPGDDSPNKVYVEAGPCSKYPKGSIDWDTIRTNLDASSNKSYHKDKDTGAEASANITMGILAKAAAVFDVSL